VVRHPDHPEWGLGHVQSVIGGRATVNWENQGKTTINVGVIDLEIVDSPGLM
jgi:hypothetical protein